MKHHLGAWVAVSSPGEAVALLVNQHTGERYTRRAADIQEMRKLIRSPQFRALPFKDQQLIYFIFSECNITLHLVPPTLRMDMYGVDHATHTAGLFHSVRVYAN